MSFHVGQKVICINDQRVVWLRRNDWLRFFRSWHLLDHNLNRGDVYTITRIRIRRDGVAGENHLMFLLAEAWHFACPTIGLPKGMMDFPSFQFRPLVERKTDITIFEQLLTPAKPKHLVDV